MISSSQAYSNWLTATANANARRQSVLAPLQNAENAARARFTDVLIRCNSPIQASRGTATTDADVASAKSALTAAEAAVVAELGTCLALDAIVSSSLEVYKQAFLAETPGPNTK